MIKRLKINNFRCFQDFEICDLAPITIIGGRNNSGKTALLESLVVPMSVVSPLVFWNLMGLRNVVTKKVTSSQMWNPLFFNMDETTEFQIDITQDSGDAISFTATKIFNGIIRLDAINQRKFNQNRGDYSSLEVKITTDKYTANGIYNLPNAILTDASDMKFTPSEDANRVPLPYGAITFYEYLTTEPPVSEIISKIILHRGKKNSLIDALKYFDDGIVDINTVFENGEGCLYVTLGPEKHLQINYMGDGINKALKILSSILNLNDGVLLIDEMENGFHYSLYNKVLKAFFETALKMNCQLLMTTHNRDLIQSALTVMTELGQIDKLSYQRLDFSGERRKAFAFTGEELADSFEMNMEMR